MTALSGKRILVTHADSFMGPAICERLREKAAEVIASDDALTAPEAAANLIHASGRVDILVANLSITAPTTAATDISEEEWRTTFSRLVDPLPRLCKAVLPQMIERQQGKIIVVGSAAALRGMKRTATYSAARGAQLAYVQALGVEVARHNIQVNAVAQNFVDNPTYFPPEIQADERFKARLQREVPLGRLVSAGEDAEFIAYLCSGAADCFVGQVFPLCGGWVNR
ncbi:MAG: short-chain dehydrogenase [Pseudomonadales bacterium]|uniref:SDR family NAD(P)-dependent oxidoreductase n=1 Tax=unclassified Ketobacter TaxID=2639109 RepID=UPI000C3EC6CF|nr:MULTISPECIES: SDR family oxidoreductase [unclassified Ketobacter]MAA59372.1 short-chain dehydrogenase [Pseudomonadales bacterium]MEC8813411.1 SDR family oxidoreductase [Pseudomonadota bacterium]TNC87969.1 MAG: short-chain dehydrogenase [Alcanivorax sp.]HAG94150.1 short-chain dehydrogenase [Gammaproteobacteria bacterium]MAQ23441.1 short-chain dehydrogenase [Pseudomonadales bacterium]|tara:strand:- start:194 stop:871 length:678 start_codon:yes stop_codon:yes gene_type:complete